jgi:hypothetical protein
MARSRMILPAPDPTCRRIFHADRLTAEGHRIALEIWIRATGREREGVRMTVYRCKRCAGFHVARKRIAETTALIAPPSEVGTVGDPDLILGI